MSKYQDHATEVAAQLITAITNGTGQWSAPWHHDGGTAWQARNATTNNTYAAGNYLTLAMTALNAGWGGEWATYRQWSTEGRQVRKGEHGTKLLRWIETKPKTQNTNTPADTDEARVFPVRFTVFNAAQLEEHETPQTQDFDPISQAEQYLAASGVTIIHTGTQAFYRPASDLIQLPDRNRFATPAAYYATALHELVHATAIKSRCDRETGAKGTKAYAAEELIAELGAAMLTGRIGLANQARQDHAAYLGEWLNILGEDPTHLFTAATKAQKAQKAVDYILNQATQEIAQDSNQAEATHSEETQSKVVAA